ncbi:proton-activated chloride channel [Salarias fasciatus]|uniref:Proton-activated chloride channel n=1 Tax=Salarias fasciatus TaxID=181472 RepID=A0A672FHE7_SALFA|nr:proton-activated chloride channel [Salarias fasciatus]
MNRTAKSRNYQEFNDDDGEDEGDAEARSAGFFDDTTEGVEPEEPEEPEELDGSIAPDEDARSATPSRRFSKSCVKNVFTVVLIFVYLLLTAVAVFLAYQTISDFLVKVNQPVMSVTYKEVDAFSPPGIAVFPGKAVLLSCRHHFHDSIPPLVDPGKPQEGDCDMVHVAYVGPFANQTEKRAVVVRGPTDVRNRELVFMQFSHNETQEDFSAISYMLFAKFTDLIESANRSVFMRDCERNYSMWTFSGGFRTWVKMSLVKTAGKSSEAVEFRQESAVVKFNDKRKPEDRSPQLFFAVFEWRDPFIQEIRLIVTANPWSAMAILCGVFMALFKAANFAKLTIQWILRMRRRQLRNRVRELNQIT